MTGRWGAAARLCAAGAIAMGLLSAPAGARAAGDAVTPSAVIVMYHRFGESALPSTNIRLDQFAAHLAELKSGGYNVMPLPEIVAALAAGKPLPDRALAITIDDAFRSVYDRAWPRLKAAGLPFTLFVATDPVDAGARGMMSWDQIRELAQAGVTIGNHGAAHAHMAFADAAANRADIAKATRRFEAELGQAPRLFAYPYGEYGSALREIVIEAGFDAALGQHSGVAFAGGDRFAIPRFALNEHYGKISRFRLVANALPLPVADVTPSDPLLGVNPPPFGFTVTADVGNLGALDCFPSVDDKPELLRLGPRRIEVRLHRPLPPGRSRINCTLPGPEGRWRWFGMQFLVPPGGG